MTQGLGSWVREATELSEGGRGGRDRLDRLFSTGAVARRCSCKLKIAKVPGLQSDIRLSLGMSTHPSTMTFSLGAAFLLVLNSPAGWRCSHRNFTCTQILMLNKN